MLNLTRRLDRITYLSQAAVKKQILCCYSTTPDAKQEEFRVLNLKSVRGHTGPKRQPKINRVFPNRSDEMPTDQDWGNVWPGPRTFQPSAVPLPIRQGFVSKGAPPSKFGNAELMKIPNFLHLTPPVIKRQCEALKQFCTPWPEGLETDEKCEAHFPLEVTSTTYCHSSPTIRDPMSRIVTIRFKVASLQFDKRAKDKFLRLVGERYDESTDIVTIVTDRCPFRKQNYDYAMYLLTALYHESLNIEEWEKLKSDADMEYYDWEKSPSKASVEKLFGKPANQIQSIKEYTDAVSKFMNEGESEYSLSQYEVAVRQLLNVPCIPE